MGMARDQENIDQSTLRSLIYQGLKIDGVRDLKGDCGYILSNMIAKYTLFSDKYLISSVALQGLKKERVDLNATHYRREFYGRKSPYTYEHAVPCSVTRNRLLEITKNTVCMDIIYETLQESLPVVIITRVENDLLSMKKLKSRMPESWSWGESQLSRYEALGIEISQSEIKMKGAVYR